MLIGCIANNGLQDCRFLIDKALNSLLETSLPVCQRRCDETLRILLTVQVDESLESASYRVALFGRLIDENGLANLTDQPRPIVEVDDEINKLITEHFPQPALRHNKYTDLKKFVVHVSHG